MRRRGRQRRAAACTREQAVAGTRRAARGRAALASSGVHDEHRSRHPLLVMHRQGFGPRSRHHNLRCTTCNILHNTIIKLILITTTLGKSYSLIITKRTNNDGLFNHNIIETPPPPPVRRGRGVGGSSPATSSLGRICRWAAAAHPSSPYQSGSTAGTVPVLSRNSACISSVVLSVPLVQRRQCFSNSLRVMCCETSAYDIPFADSCACLASPLSRARSPASHSKMQADSFDRKTE